MEERSGFLFIFGTVPATAFGRQDSAPSSTLASNGQWLNTGCGTSLELMVVPSVLVNGYTSRFFAPLLNLQVWAGLGPSRSLAFSAPNLYNETGEPVPWQVLPHCRSVSHLLPTLSWVCGAWHPVRELAQQEKQEQTEVHLPCPVISGCAAQYVFGSFSQEAVPALMLMRPFCPLNTVKDLGAWKLLLLG